MLATKYDIKKSLILCVDDEKIVLDSLLLQLRKNFNQSFEIEMSTEPEEALQIMKESIREGYHVPLVISDYLMPGMKGDSFLKEVHELSSSTFKVMLTGQATLEGISNAVNKANLFRYLSKPWDEIDLVMTINNVLDSYQKELKVRELSERNETLYNDIKESFVSYIKSLADAIDARDKYTIGHSHRVTKYSLMIADRLGFSKEKQETLEHMSILHDIGKIGIPDIILLKNNKLTENEYYSMKQHVTIGADILKRATQFENLLPGILYHHERFDGNGYVFGIKGEEIPVESRIICITDAFDAMTSDRPYRKGLSKETALTELKKCASTQFDPEIVDIFCDIMETCDIDNTNSYFE